MIRREHLATSRTTGATMTGAEAAAKIVKRGESVRIQGLGTLARAGEFRRAGEEPTPVYRLTLTAAVAKQWPEGLARTDEDATAWVAMVRDVRHIARAIGAPVEVWAPNACKAQGCVSECGPKCITTVRP